MLVMMPVTVSALDPSAVTTCGVIDDTLKLKVAA